MTLGIAFWILMLLFLVIGFWGPRVEAFKTYAPMSGNILFFFLLLLLGLHSFGSPIRG